MDFVVPLLLNMTPMFAEVGETLYGEGDLMVRTVYVCVCMYCVCVCVEVGETLYGEGDLMVRTVCVCVSVCVLGYVICGICVWDVLFGYVGCVYVV
jgi:hypothetical protein